jgi:hypothetical protein
MAARTRSRVTPKYKTKYRVRNWAKYEESLRRRGDITVWFDEAAIEGWSAAPSGRPGGQRTFSDLAIVTALTLRLVFHLALRQVEGFVSSLLALLGLGLPTPDHTTLSRRGKTVEVPVVPRQAAGPLNLVIDSTGLKIAGDGEWHARKHGLSNKRRQWHKLHLGIDGDGFIVASALTESGADDALVGEQLLDGVDALVASFRGDGAYDTRAFWTSLPEAGGPDIDVAIPPRRTASSSGPGDEAWQRREEAVRRIHEVGRREWRKESGANQQARAENGMGRFKQIVGDHLRSRTKAGQTTEARIGVNILNRMAVLGMPESAAIRA